jgi:hypothetical protein
VQSSGNYLQLPGVPKRARYSRCVDPRARSKHNLVCHDSMSVVVWYRNQFSSYKCPGQQLTFAGILFESPKKVRDPACLDPGPVQAFKIVHRQLLLVKPLEHHICVCFPLTLSLAVHAIEPPMCNSMAGVTIQVLSCCVKKIMTLV